MFCCKSHKLCLAQPNVSFKINSEKRAWQTVSHPVAKMEAQDLPDEEPSFESYVHLYGVKYYQAASFCLHLYNSHHKLLETLLFFHENQLEE